MLIEIIDIFLGAFYHYFPVEDPNFTRYAQYVVLGVMAVMLVTSCVCLCILLHDIIKYFGGVFKR